MELVIRIYNFIDKFNNQEEWIGSMSILLYSIDSNVLNSLEGPIKTEDQTHVDQYVNESIPISSLRKFSNQISGINHKQDL